MNIGFITPFNTCVVVKFGVEIVYRLEHRLNMLLALVRAAELVMPIVGPFVKDEHL